LNCVLNGCYYRLSVFNDERSTVNSQSNSLISISW